MLEPATLQFLGGAGTVTGSKYLIRANGRQILLDCGLFQGLKELRLRNWNRPPFQPQQIDAVVLSHAHIDHSGYLPLLARQGFRGPILCTPGTADLVRVLLPDSAHLQEEEAARANRYHYSKHKPALPLYDTQDASAALRLLEGHRYGEFFAVTDGIRGKFRRAGHILGSASVELLIGTDQPFRLVFSGDIGRWNQPILRDPELVAEADMLLVESTYGNRVHPRNPVERLAQIVRETAQRGGVLLVPAFAIGRTQELIWRLRELETAGQIPSLPVYIDSPMAIDVSELYCRHPDDHDLDMKQVMDEKRCPLCCIQYHLTRTPQESKALNHRKGPLIIISASGMATGGRIVHHLKHRLPDPNTTVLLIGFQAAGTRGRALRDGAQSLRIHGLNVPVRARVEVLDGFSAHADQEELLRWLSGFEKPPRQVFVVHGEAGPAESLAETLRTQWNWNAKVAQDGDTVALVR